MSDQEKWREEFEALKIPEMDYVKNFQGTYEDINTLRAWLVYLAARSKAQEEIDALKKVHDLVNHSDVEKSFEIEDQHIEITQLKKQLEDLKLTLEDYKKYGQRVYAESVKRGSDIDKRDKEITHLKSLLSQAVPWVKRVCGEDRQDLDSKRQWLKEAEEVLK